MTDSNAPDGARGETLGAALGASGGVVCLVGAGGKKTTMYALAAACRGRVALSSTAHMYEYDRALVDQIVQVDEAGLASDRDARVVAFAGTTDTARRVGGLTAEQLRALRDSAQFELILIKADGARARWIKAPADYEPLIPEFADSVIPVVSAGVLGRRLDSGIAHRPELAAAVMRTTAQSPLEPVHLARLLCSPLGALKGVGTARVVPLINMVDDEPTRILAREVAELALAQSERFERVVLARMKARRIVEIVGR